jgi:uncharacterized protein
MIFLDTGYLLAVVNPRDALHQRAMAWSLYVTEPVVTTEFVLLEAANALANRPGRERCELMIGYVRQASSQIFPASSELLNAGLDLYQWHRDKDWSLTDCISFHIMRQSQITQALAHDHHFEQAGFDALLRRDPS